MTKNNEMNFVLSIRSDENCSRSILKAPLDNFIGKLRGVERAGDDSFEMELPGDGRLQIQLLFVRVEHGNLIACHPTPEIVNCVRLSMASFHRNPQAEQECYWAAYEVTKRLGWRLHDDTDKGDWISKEYLENVLSREARSWWDLWH